MDVLTYKYFGISEKGRRPRNEDAVLTLRLDENTCFFAVADGMGGVKGGEIASNTALQSIIEYLEKQIDNGGISAENLKDILAALFDEAKSAIKNFVDAHDDYKGMGTTLAVLLIHKDRYVWGNIGDSRIYLVNGSEVLRFTRDHNLVEDSNYQTSKEELANMPEQYLHALTRVVDGEESKPDIFPADEPWFTMKKNDTWILCSDGLIIDKQGDYGKMLSGFTSRMKDPESLAESLVENALENGSSDNISVVVVKVMQDESNEDDFQHNAPTQKIILPQSANTKTIPARKTWLWLILLIGALTLLVFIILYSYFDLNWFSFKWKGLFGWEGYP